MEEGTRVSLAGRIESTRIGWWIERFWHSRCFRHDWRRIAYHEDTGYSYVLVENARECAKCGAWERLP